MLLELEVSDEHLKHFAATDRVDLRNSATLKRIRNIRVHFEPFSSSRAHGDADAELAHRDHGLESILWWNNDVKQLELVSYGSNFHGSGLRIRFQNEMIKTSYCDRFGGLLRQLEAKQRPVRLYNVVSKQMEENTEFTQEAFKLVNIAHL